MKSVMVEDNRELDFLYFNDFPRSPLEEPNPPPGSVADCAKRLKRYQDNHPGKSADSFYDLVRNNDCVKPGEFESNPTGETPVDDAEGGTPPLDPE